MYYEFRQQVVELDKSLVKKCITRPYDPGITNPKAPETCSEILVFVPKSQKFQPEGPSVVVCSQNGWNYSVPVTSYLQVARQFYQTSQYRIVLAQVQWFNPNCVNPRRDQEAVGKEELKKEELGTKGEGNDEVIQFYLYVCFS